MGFFKRRYRNYYIGIGLMLMVVNLYCFDLLPAMKSADRETKESYREYIRQSIVKKSKDLPMDMGDVIVLSSNMTSADTLLTVNEIPDSAMAADLDLAAMKDYMIDNMLGDSRIADPIRKGEVTLVYRYLHAGEEIGRVVITPDEI